MTSTPKDEGREGVDAPGGEEMGAADDVTNSDPVRVPLDPTAAEVENEPEVIGEDLGYPNVDQDTHARKVATSTGALSGQAFDVNGTSVNHELNIPTAYQGDAELAGEESPQLLEQHHGGDEVGADFGRTQQKGAAICT